MQEADIEGKLVFDAGSGHGILTSAVAGMGAKAIGMELSLAVDNACQRNTNARAWYVQGDVQLPPFAPGIFDILYSNGVLHHTNNTKLSLSLVEPMLKAGALICLWLYQPCENKLHQLSTKARRVFSKIPLKFAVAILIIFVLPFTFIIRKINGQFDLHYREEIIDLLDAFTPEFRNEIPQAQAMAWLQQLGLSTCGITSSGVFGYPITGCKTD
ncbi:class I SAM-dependent methyltransferase [Pollutibacter soli]|uniref:class I SAM-dependent methyltransferase n=1 Tax=Pollutibacter soli TaxID=3034157 RepID=UPI003013A0EA